MQTAAVSSAKAGASSAPALSPPSREPSTSSLLLSTLGAYSELTKQLFLSIENPSQARGRCISDASAAKTWTTSDIPSILAALHEADQLLASRIQLAHQHAANQAHIDHLQARAKRRDRETRQAILELSQIHSELAEITRLADEELASIERAETRPIGHATLLAYAQRLARYTSAPPGYKLPQVASASAKAEAAAGGECTTKAEDGAELPEQIALGADYNQYAKRAAAYYDPAIPSMPQEMPFPSDAMMRQGILNSHEMLNGAPMAEQPEEEGMLLEDQDELPAPDFATSYSHLREQQQRQEEEEDAFDLDLN